MKPKSSNQADNALIASYLAERGVTACPAAFAEVTSGTLSDADMKSHVARGLDPVGDAGRAKSGGWARYWAARKKRGEAPP